MGVGQGQGTVGKGILPHPTWYKEIHMADQSSEEAARLHK